MIRKLIVLALVAGAIYFVYQRINRPMTEEDRIVANLRDRYSALVTKFTSAMGRAGNIGMDTTFDVETAVNRIKELRSAVDEARRTLTEERAIGKADELAAKIDEFFKKNEILGP
jgi:hypothetical protein